MTANPASFERIRNLRQSGIPRRLIYRFITTVNPLWLRYRVGHIDHIDKRKTPIWKS